MPEIIFPNTPPLPIVQQPNGEYTWVSNNPNEITEFSMSQKWYNVPTYGAHSYEAGRYISALNPGDLIGFRYGNERRGGGYSKRVSAIRKFQALNPTDPTSLLVDLRSGKKYTSTHLSKELYDNKKKVVFQTCIEKDGNKNWGRLFVITE